MSVVLFKFIVMLFLISHLSAKGWKLKIVLYLFKFQRSRYLFGSAIRIKITITAKEGNVRTRAYVWEASPFHEFEFETKYRVTIHSTHNSLSRLKLIILFEGEKNKTFYLYV